MSPSLAVSPSVCLLQLPRFGLAVSGPTRKVRKVSASKLPDPPGWSIRPVNGSYGVSADLDTMPPSEVPGDVIDRGESRDERVPSAGYEASGSWNSRQALTLGPAAVQWRVGGLNG